MPAVGFSPSFLARCEARRSCGAGLQACGRLSSRSGCPLPTALSSTQPLPPWSKPPGLPCRRSRRQSNTISSVTGVPTPSAAKTGGVARRTARSTSTCRRPRGTRRSCGARCSCGAGFQAWAPFTHRPLFHPKRSLRGASRQACHAGGHAGRATQSRALRAFPRHPPPRLAAWHAGLRAPPPPAAALVGHAALVRQAFQPAAGFRAGLGALYPPPSLPPKRSPRGASRQACHAGAHAGRATHTQTVRERQLPQDCTLHAPLARELLPGDPLRSASLRQPCDILATLCSSAGRRTSGDSGPSFSCCCFLWPPPPKTLLPPAP